MTAPSPKRLTIKVEGAECVEVCLDDVCIKGFYQPDASAAAHAYADELVKHFSAPTAQAQPWSDVRTWASEVVRGTRTAVDGGELTAAEALDGVLLELEAFQQWGGPAEAPKRGGDEAAQHGGEACKDVERHAKLHRSLDELVACWLVETTDVRGAMEGTPPKLMSNTTIMELVRWSARKAGARS